MDLPFCVGVSPTLKIRGIIAERLIPRGKVIERCPVILFPIKQEDIINEMVLGKYHYEWNKKFDSFVLGYGALINHSDTPNTVFHYDYRNKYLVFVAKQDIAPKEEVTVDYQQGTNTPLDPDYVDYNKDINQ